MLRTKNRPDGGYASSVIEKKRMLKIIGTLINRKSSMSDIHVVINSIDIASKNHAWNVPKSIFIRCAFNIEMLGIMMR